MAFKARYGRGRHAQLRGVRVVREPRCLSQRGGGRAVWSGRRLPLAEPPDAVRGGRAVGLPAGSLAGRPEDPAAQRRRIGDQDGRRSRSGGPREPLSRWGGSRTALDAGAVIFTHVGQEGGPPAPFSFMPKIIKRRKNDPVAQMRLYRSLARPLSLDGLFGMGL